MTNIAQFPELAQLYIAMKREPDNRDYQLAYYKALAGARLSDFYVLCDVNEDFKQALRTIAEIAGIYEDEIKYTPDDYIKLLQSRLGRVAVLCTRAAREDFPKEETS